MDGSREAYLLAASRSDDVRLRDAAFEELYAELRLPIYLLCLRLIGRRAEAEEAVQEVFVAAYRALPAFRGESRLSTWLYRIAARTAVRVRSRLARQPTPDESVVSRTAERPDEVARVDFALDLQSALATLPLEQRTILILFSVRGLSHQEIASIVGVPEGTIWSRLHRARRLLAAAMSERRAPQ